MFKQLKYNDRGVVFVTVLIIIIVAMVLAVNVLSLNISQVTSTEEELKYIKAKVLADGGLAQILISQFSGAPTNTLTFSETLDNITYTIDVLIDGAGVPLPGSDSSPLDIDVTF